MVERICSAYSGRNWIASTEWESFFEKGKNRIVTIVNKRAIIGMVEGIFIIVGTDKSIVLDNLE